MATRTADPAMMAEKKNTIECCEPINAAPKFVNDYAGLIAAVKAEENRLRTVDIYLNDDGNRRLSACGKIRFLSAFCGSATDLVDLELYDELSDDLAVIQDIMMAIDRIAKMERGSKK